MEARRGWKMMSIRAHQVNRIGRAAAVAVAAIFCVPAAWVNAQYSRPAAPHAARRPRAYAPAPHPAQPPYRGLPQANAERPGNPASRPAYPYAAPHAQFPPGHLGDWLYQHRNLPVQEQVRILRTEPSFHSLPPIEQQRLIQQLHQVNQLTEEQRQRRLARAEIIEHLAPQDRMRINLSARRWAELPPERQTLMKSAFRDLRAVPVEQRPMVLNSARYQGVFSPDERGILADMLRVEPYQPAR
jgi:hypothetical protein